MRTLFGALLGVVVVAASSGCAAIAAKAPDPDRPRDQPPMCNDGKGGVVVDGLMATALGVITLAIASEGEGEAAALTGLGALGYGISAGVGSSSANKCRAAQEDYLAQREREDVEEAFTRASAGGPGGMPVAPEEEEDEEEEDDEENPAPPPATPTPAPKVQPVKPPAPAPRTTAASSEDDGGGDDGDWSEFWKEVP